MGNLVLWSVVLLALLGFAVGAYPRRIVLKGSSEKPVGAVNTFLEALNGAKKHLVSAAVARSVSILGMYPLDTIKTRIQIEHPKPFSLSGLYGGVTGSLLGQVPYGVLVFGSYEVYKRELMKKFPKTNPMFVFATASVLGDLTGSFCLCPSEVIKQKIQAGLFPNQREALISIWRSRGFLGFYEGYFGGLARDIPFRVAQLTTYEMTKKLYLTFKARRVKNKGDGKGSVELSAIESAACGAFAGSISAAITSPLDRIKTILMTDGAAYGGSVITCATKIFQEEGIRGLATGMVPRVVYIAPSVAVFFVAYEACQQRLKNWS
mmetsp:Transcript_60877/g.170634  ORF Transcript_60877/g.170634 Transcript_60877/m.170634 type:complete len:321 (-) Transcript_60877:657-1619(-)